MIRAPVSQSALLWRRRPAGRVASPPDVSLPTVMTRSFVVRSTNRVALPMSRTVEQVMALLLGCQTGALAREGVKFRLP
ncbi:hypothetical protein GCM10020227_47300 [Streptomyces flavovirens]